MALCMSCHSDGCRDVISSVYTNCVLVARVFLYLLPAHFLLAIITRLLHTCFDLIVFYILFSGS